MKRAVFLLFLGLITAIFGFAQSDLQPAATVNLVRSEAITVKQLRTEVERMEKAAGQTLNQAQRLEVLNVMINERLVLQAADRDRIAIADNEVNQQMQQLRGQLAQSIGRQPTDAEFAQAIKNDSGLEVQEFREQLRRQMLVQKYLMTKKESTIKSIKVPTEEDIRTTFSLTRSQFVRPDTVRFSMIQVPYGPDAASRARAKQLADNLIREIGTSTSKFDEVAARGQAANSGYQAGDGGYLPRNMAAQQMVGQAFINTAFSLRQGEVSRLIEGVPGFQIIKVTENHAMKNLELDDILQLGTRITVRDYIGNALLQERQQAILAQASQELVTELRRGNPFRIMEANIRW